MKRGAKLIGLLALLLVSPLAAYAQEQAGSIQGTVKDATGAVLPGVTIEVRSPAVVGASTTTSDAEGRYRFHALPAATYELSAALQGFTPVKMPGVVIQLGQVLKIDVTLSMASVSESVQVTAESPIIDVKQNAATQTVSREIIERIPKGRDFTSVITSAPGTNDESRAGGLQIDGASGSENRFVIDGVDTTNLQNGTSGKTVFTDFVDQVQIKSSGYAAEYGGSTGGVINAITKSGSNQFHGSFGTYYRNEDLQGATRKGWRINPFYDCAASSCTGAQPGVPPLEFVATPPTAFSNWNPIGDIGGPVLMDKLWFYFGSSYNRTDNERTTTFRNSAPVGGNYVTKEMTSWSDNKYYNFKTTSQVNNNLRLTFSGALTRNANRGSIAGSLQPDGSVFADDDPDGAGPRFGSPTNGFNTATWDVDPEKFKDRWERTGGNSRNDLYSANADWVITPKFFANIQAGYLAYDNTTPPEFAGQAIIHTFSGANTCVGNPGSATCPFPEIPAELRQTSGYSDNKSTNRTVRNLFDRAYLNANTSLFASFKGEHQFKFGMRVERLGNDVDTGPQLPTITLFWNGARSTSDGRTVRGQYGYYQVSRGTFTQGEVTSNNWSFWAQDSWTVRRNLTVNAGVRTENEHVPSYAAQYPGIDFGFAEKIAPRLGFAYDVKGDSRWKTYASYGKYFDITKLEMPRGSFGADHWIQYFWTLDSFNWPSINCQEGSTGCPGTFIEEVDLRHPANQADPRLTAYFGQEQNTLEPNLKPVETGEATFGLDHELNRTMSVGVRYTHKWLDRTIEDVGIVVPGVGEVFFIANPGYGVAEQILPKPAPVLPKAVRDYDGIEFRLNRRLSNNWSAFAGYTWSRLYGNYGGLASSDENGRTSPNVDRYFDGQYLLFDSKGQPVEGLLPTDRPHYFKGQLTYDMPWGTNVGVFTQVSSGTPLSTIINLQGFSPTFINGRGDLGRTPVFSQTDLFLQHDFRVFGRHNVNLNVNIDNLFDQDIVTNLTTTPWRNTFSVPSSLASSSTTPGVLSARDAYLLSGYDPLTIVNAMRASGANMRDNSLYGKPSSFQGPRVIRLGIKYSF
jgi:hypothetical protein